MQLFLRISGHIDAFNRRLGRAMSWAILAVVIVSSLNASVRYALNTSSNAWLELQWYLFSAVFLLGSAYTLQQNEHIRIDIVNATLSRRWRSLSCGQGCTRMTKSGSPARARSRPIAPVPRLTWRRT